MASMSGNRFANLTDAEIENIEANQDSKSTKKVVEKAVRAFQAYLKEKGQDIAFESFATMDLDTALKNFYANARTIKGDLYKLSSFNQMKYGLHKYLLGKGIDTSTVAFTKSNETFKAMKKDLMRNWKGDVKHRTPISATDLKKLYQHKLAFNVLTPVGLQQKVMFEIILFMCRRGRENLRNMTKDFYGIFQDEDGREYVQQQLSELDKNHDENRRSSETTGEGRMYGIPGAPACPVASFKKYVGKLHPECNSLWQRPLDSFLPEADIWYCNSPVGQNMTQTFMPRLSKFASLSETYTNHSIRATSITLMDNAGIEARHIMRVSGHR